MKQVTEPTFASITIDGEDGKKVISTKVSAQEGKVHFKVNAEESTRPVGYATMYEYKVHEFNVPKSKIHIVSAAVEKAKMSGASHVTIAVKQQGSFAIPKTAFPEITEACDPKKHFAWTPDKDDVHSFLKQYAKDCAAQREETRPNPNNKKRVKCSPSPSTQHCVPA